MKMISLDDIIEYCDNERTAYKANNCGAACTALRRVVEFAKEYAVEVETDNGWISVKDRLPEYDKTVLVVNEDGYMHTAVRIKGSIARIDEWQIKFGVCFTDNDVWEEDEQGKITHWQYLPEPPKGE